MKARQLVGDISTQKVYDTNNIMCRSIGISIDGKEVRLIKLLAKIHEIFQDMSDEDKERMLSLYVMSCCPAVLDFSQHDNKLKASAFMHGFMLGRFFGSTKATIISDLVERDNSDIIDKIEKLGNGIPEG